MNIQDMIDVLQAAKAGKTIQYAPAGEYNSTSSTRWVNALRPMWNFAEIDYRVKPEPREWTILVESSGTVRGGAQGYRDGQVLTYGGHGLEPKMLTPVRVREVLD